MSDGLPNSHASILDMLLEPGEAAQKKRCVELQAALGSSPAQWVDLGCRELALRPHTLTQIHERFLERLDDLARGQVRYADLEWPLMLYVQVLAGQDRSLHEAWKTWHETRPGPCPWSILFSSTTPIHPMPEWLEGRIWTHCFPGPITSSLLADIQALLSRRGCACGVVLAARACQNRGGFDLLPLLIHSYSSTGLGLAPGPDPGSGHPHQAATASCLLQWTTIDRFQGELAEQLSDHWHLSLDPLPPETRALLVTLLLTLGREVDVEKVRHLFSDSSPDQENERRFSVHLGWLATSRLDLAPRLLKWGLASSDETWRKQIHARLPIVVSRDVVSAEIWRLSQNRGTPLSHVLRALGANPRSRKPVNTFPQSSVSWSVRLSAGNRWEGVWKRLSVVAVSGTVVPVLDLSGNIYVDTPPASISSAVIDLEMLWDVADVEGSLAVTYSLPPTFAICVEEALGLYALLRPRSASALRAEFPSGRCFLRLGLGAYPAGGDGLATDVLLGGAVLRLYEPASASLRTQLLELLDGFAIDELGAASIQGEEGGLTHIYRARPEVEQARVLLDDAYRGGLFEKGGRP